MVYEYCDIIKNSGINRNAIPASCTDFVEMGMYCAAESQKAFNEVFHKLGDLEYKRYVNGAINESSTIEYLTEGKFLEAIAKPFKKLWEAIKAAWEKIVAFIEKKIQEYTNKVGKKFKALKIDNYKDKIDEISKQGKFLQVKVIDQGRLTDIKNTVISNAEKWTRNGSGEIDKSFSVKRLGATIAAAVNKTDVYQYCSDNAFGIVLSDRKADNKSAEDAKKHIYGMVSTEKASNAKEAAINTLGTKVVDYKWLSENKNRVAEYINTTAISDLRKDYVTAKKEIDRVIKDLKEFDKGGEETVKGREFCKLKITQAEQTCLLAIAQLRKEKFIEYVKVASKVVMIAAREDAKPKVKQESARIKYDSDFVNECFNW